MTIFVNGEVGAKCCGELRNIYCEMGNMKVMIEEMHDRWVASGTPPLFEDFEAAHYLVRDLYHNLERFIRPIVGEESIYRAPGDDSPVCRM